jgi:hypothetical protein
MSKVLQPSHRNDPFSAFKASSVLFVSLPQYGQRYVSVPFGSMPISLLRACVVSDSSIINPGEGSFQFAGGAA